MSIYLFDYSALVYLNISLLGKIVKVVYKIMGSPRGAKAPLSFSSPSPWRVIASEAKQSHTIAVRDCFVALLLAMT